MGGVWSKLYIALGGLSGGYGFVVPALMISSLLNVAYLMPIVVRAFFRAPDLADDHGYGATGSDVMPDEQPSRIAEAPWFCVVPLCFTAVACIVLFFLPDAIEMLLSGMLEVPR
ncbi:MAG TPA: hypothetical protein DIT35_04420 [Rhodospirillaceae bacterium]|nr:hypothetical protein [Rhodospirillaceae bacterium]